MSQVNSIAGNDGFSRIRDVLGQVTNLNGVDITAVNLNAGTVKAETLTAQALSPVPRGVTLITADLYTSPAIATGFAIGVQALWNVETDAIFRFPANSHIVAAQMSGVDLVGAGATFDAGPAGTIVTTNTVFNDTPIADLANTEGVSVQAPTTTCVLGTTGIAPSVAAALDNYFNLATIGTAVSYGRIYVRVTYYIRA